MRTGNKAQKIHCLASTARRGPEGQRMDITQCGRYFPMSLSHSVPRSTFERLKDSNKRPHLCQHCIRLGSNQ